MVLPGSPWVKVETATVEKERELEVLAIAIATDAAFYGHDFTVHSLGDAVGDSMFAVAYDVLDGRSLSVWASDLIEASLV